MKKEEQKVPYISQEVISYLDKKYPDRVPNYTSSLDEVRLKMGQIGVVRHLKKLHQDQLKEV